MKKTLMTIVTLVFFIKISFVGVAAINDGAGHFQFNVDYTPCISFGILYISNPTYNWGQSSRDWGSTAISSRSTWDAEINSNDMTIHTYNNSFIGSMETSTFVSACRQVWIPPVSGFGGHAGYWKTEYAQPLNINFSLNLSACGFLSKTTSIDPFAPFHFPYIYDDNVIASIHTALTVNGELFTIDTDVPAYMRIPSGTVYDSNYPHSLEILYSPNSGGIRLDGPIFLGSFGDYQVSFLPEPTSLLLLGLGGLLIRKR